MDRHCQGPMSAAGDYNVENNMGGVLAVWRHGGAFPSSASVALSLAPMPPSPPPPPWMRRQGFRAEI